MKVLNERMQVKQAIQSWLNAYGLDGTYGADKRQRKVGEELLILDPETATADQIAEIIGNSSWAYKKECGECGKESWEIVQIGEDLDYESRTAFLCAECLRAALQILGADETIYLKSLLREAKLHICGAKMSMLVRSSRSLVDVIEKIDAGK